MTTETKVFVKFNAKDTHISWSLRLYLANVNNWLLVTCLVAHWYSISPEILTLSYPHIQRADCLEWWLASLCMLGLSRSSSCCPWYFFGRPKRSLHKSLASPLLAGSARVSDWDKKYWISVKQVNMLVKGLFLFLRFHDGYLTCMHLFASTLPAICMQSTYSVKTTWESERHVERQWRTWEKTPFVRKDSHRDECNLEA